MFSHESHSEALVARRRLDGHRSEHSSASRCMRIACSRTPQGESNDPTKEKTLAPSSDDALDKFVKRWNFGALLDHLLERKIQKYLNDKSDNDGSPSQRPQPPLAPLAASRPEPSEKDRENILDLAPFHVQTCAALTIAEMRLAEHKNICKQVILHGGRPALSKSIHFVRKTRQSPTFPRPQKRKANIQFSLSVRKHKHKHQWRCLPSLVFPFTAINFRHIT